MPLRAIKIQSGVGVNPPESQSLIKLSKYPYILTLKMEKHYLSKLQKCKQLGKSRPTLDNWIKKGKIPQKELKVVTKKLILVSEEWKP